MARTRSHFDSLVWSGWVGMHSSWWRGRRTTRTSLGPTRGVEYVPSGVSEKTVQIVKERRELPSNSHRHRRAIVHPPNPRDTTPACVPRLVYRVGVSGVVLDENTSKVWSVWVRVSGAQLRRRECRRDVRAMHAVRDRQDRGVTVTPHLPPSHAARHPALINPIAKPRASQR
ncbi:hypothetical protein CERSUDRAFT_120296 [Gelatoporia subvermispora B]|uniref:Uncharacterized protein n=1 Tax=Ceriporiopsis subvermispora (strain B) TaxID=914234 RepID=M2QY09_CERS8|nr:hypothetical protein CERSUDRAFT_120296 [Gelatoporia subvermispora B]